MFFFDLFCHKAFCLSVNSSWLLSAAAVDKKKKSVRSCNFIVILVLVLAEGGFFVLFL